MQIIGKALADIPIFQFLLHEKGAKERKWIMALSVTTLKLGLKFFGNHGV